MNLLALHRDTLWTILALLPAYQPMQLLRLSREWLALRSNTWYTRYTRRYRKRYKYGERVRALSDGITDGADDVSIWTAARAGRTDLLPDGTLSMNMLDLAAKTALKYGHVDTAIEILCLNANHYGRTRVDRALAICMQSGYVDSLHKLHRAGCTRWPVLGLLTSDQDAVARYIYRYLHPEEWQAMRLQPPRIETVYVLCRALESRSRGLQTVRLITI